MKRERRECPHALKSASKRKVCNLDVWTHSGKRVLWCHYSVQLNSAIQWKCTTTLITTLHTLLRFNKSTKPMCSLRFTYQQLLYNSIRCFKRSCYRHIHPLALTHPCQAHVTFNAIFILASLLEAVDRRLFQLQDVNFQLVLRETAHFTSIWQIIILTQNIIIRKSFFVRCAKTILI